MARLVTSACVGAAAAASPLEAIRHVYNHILGVPSPFNPSDVFSANRESKTAALPRTDVFARPVAASVYVCESAIRASLQLPEGVRGEGGLDLGAAARAAAVRTGLHPLSTEVARTNALAIRGTLDAGVAAEWSDAQGYVSARGGNDGTLRPIAWLRYPACSDAFAPMLKDVFGLHSAPTFARDPEGCPVLITPEDVTLNLADKALRHAVSEAVVIVAAADATVEQYERTKAANSPAGLILNRFYLTGLTSVAKQFGADSREYSAVARLYKVAIDTADKRMRSSFPADRVATVVAVTDAIWAGDAQPRALSGTTGVAAAAATGYTLADIAEYQVCLWTGILLAAMLIGTIYFMLGMDTNKDPALYVMLMDSSAASHAGAAAGATASR